MPFPYDWPAAELAARLAGHDLIDALGWACWVGAEYRPRAATRDGLGWFRTGLRAGP